MRNCVGFTASVSLIHLAGFTGMFKNILASSVLLLSVSALVSGQETLQWDPDPESADLPVSDASGTWTNDLGATVPIWKTFGTATINQFSNGDNVVFGGLPGGTFAPTVVSVQRDLFPVDLAVVAGSITVRQSGSSTSWRFVGDQVTSSSLSVGNLTAGGSGTVSVELNNQNTTGAISLLNGASLTSSNATSAALSATSINLAAGTSFINSVGGTSTFGSVTGAGQISNNGLGNIVVTGDSSLFTGMTTINSGSLTFNSGSNQLHTTVISGNGSLIKEGAGTLTLTAANTYIGGTTINNGTVNLGAGGSIAGNVSLASASSGLSFSHSDLVTFGGNVTGGVGSLSQLGTGILNLTGSNSVGTLLASNGTTLVNGTTNTSVGTTVSNGALLGGSGTLNSAVTVQTGGHLSPGNSPGTLNLSSLTMTSGSVFDYEINYSNLAASDLVNVTGLASLGSATLNLMQFSSGTINIGNTVTLMNYGSLSGIFSGWSNGSTHAFGGFDWTINYGSGSNSSITLSAASVSAVPEPSSVCLVGLAIGGLALRRRKRA